MFHIGMLSSRSSVQQLTNVYRDNPNPSIDLAKCSRLTEAHDDPLSTPDSPPTIDEFEADIKVLADWIKSIRKRR